MGYGMDVAGLDELLEMRRLVTELMSPRGHASGGLANGPEENAIRDARVGGSRHRVTLGK